MSHSGQINKEITCEIIGKVYRITLNRPEARNAQNRAMLDEIDSAFKFAAANSDIRVVILAAAGDHFSAGHDLKEAQRDRAHQSAEIRFSQEGGQVLPDLYAHPRFPEADDRAGAGSVYCGGADAREHV